MYKVEKSRRVFSTQVNAMGIDILEERLGDKKETAETCRRILNLIFV